MIYFDLHEHIRIYMFAQYCNLELNKIMIYFDLHEHIRIYMFAQYFNCEFIECVQALYGGLVYTD